MINSLNPAAMQAQGVNVQNNVKAAPAMINPMSVPAPVQTQDLNGLDALAGYNQPLKPAKFEITPALPTVLQPEAIRVIKGERVTDSTGKLNSIIDKNDKTTVIYQMDENAPNDAISKIITLDNATGNIIRAQENTNEIKQGKMPVIKEILIREYTPNGDLAKVTEYDNENNYFVQQHEKMNDGSKKMYCVSKHSSYVTEEDANGNRVKTTQFTPSGQIGEVVYFDNDNETQVVTYKNGIPAKIENKNLETFNPELAKNSCSR